VEARVDGGRPGSRDAPPFVVDVIRNDDPYS
jgi:hypothetical protein